MNQMKNVIWTLGLANSASPCLKCTFGFNVRVTQNFLDIHLKNVLDFWKSVLEKSWNLITKKVWTPCFCLCTKYNKNDKHSIYEALLYLDILTDYTTFLFLKGILFIWYSTFFNWANCREKDCWDKTNILSEWTDCWR